MKNLKFLLLLIPIFTTLAFTGCAAETSSKNTTGIEQTSIILYYGTGCPHCQKVEQYLKDNKVSDKISFQSKEVYSNEANSNEMNDKATNCGLKTENVGVPFLWDGSNCIMGDQKVIEFFKKKI